ncbi:hypothetical protein PIB30_072336 [Stylosanthes scabra]|uniref:DUF674 family protein n=1 Tax=Stylosanthes scabra TaxID=79078 RepID=A0ABU6XMG2_9FABA|nr:hypothetical protein [Stylosanthes scabra]
MSSNSTKAENQVRLKLLIHKEKNIVLYAEAGKDFVDALFSFLTLPLGDIVRLAGEKSNIPAVSVGCLTTIYQSVAKLDDECLRNENCKKMLLHPRNMPMELYRHNLKLNVSGSETLNYFSSYGCSCLSAFKNVSSCCSAPSTSYEVKDLTSFREFRNGFVKENNFIIRDDLYVMPNSIDNSLPLLRKHGVQNINHVLEQTIIVSKKEQHGCNTMVVLANLGDQKITVEEKSKTSKQQYYWKQLSVDYFVLSLSSSTPSSSPRHFATLKTDNEVRERN